MSANIFLGIALILSIIGNGFLAYFLTKLHIAEKKELHDRIMARDYPEYMQGKDFELELERKEKEINKKPGKPVELAPADNLTKTMVKDF